MPKVRIRRGTAIENTLSRLLKEAGNAFSVTQDGKLSSESFASSDFLTMISLCLEHDVVDTSATMRGAILTGIKSICLTGDTSPESFLAACNAPKPKRSRSTNQYAMWSDLHLEPDSDGTLHISTNDVRVYIANSLPKTLARSPTPDLDRLSVYERLPPRSFIWGHTKAQSDGEAGTKISYAFESLQALVNFQSHFRQGIDLFKSSLHHSSAFQIGPNFYLYNKDTKAWPSLVWMVEHYNGKLWRKQRTRLSAISNAFDAIKSHHNRLRNSPFSARLWNALRHLNTVWITPSKSERALSVWMALEALYAERSARSDQGTIIRRATKDMEPNERWLMEQRLRFVSELRNSTVHAHGGFKDLDDQEHVLQICTQFVMACYIDVLQMSRGPISNENQLFAYLDASSQISALKERRKLLDYKIGRLESRAD